MRQYAKIKKKELLTFANLDESRNFIFKIYKRMNEITQQY